MAEQGAAVIDRAADILGDWGWMQAGREDLHQGAPDYDCQDPGKMLAKTLEAELAGFIVCRSGRIFERNVDGK